MMGASPPHPMMGGPMGHMGGPVPFSAPTPLVQQLAGMSTGSMGNMGNMGNMGAIASMQPMHQMGSMGMGGGMGMSAGGMHRPAQAPQPPPPSFGQPPQLLPSFAPPLSAGLGSNMSAGLGSNMSVGLGGAMGARAAGPPVGLAMGGHGGQIGLGAKPTAPLQVRARPAWKGSPFS